MCQYVRPLGEHLSPIDLDAAAEQHERLLSEACAKALNQRDVALARVASLESKLAELEKQEPVGVMRASSEMGVAPYADIWPWLEPGQKLYTTPVAQAQHCVVLDAEKLIAHSRTVRRMPEIPSELQHSTMQSARYTPCSPAPFPS
ncbi:hypothetical protein [Pseudomonas aeruginosa]|uniref:hypothetical protein n=1 Tax=Pseudomonas aeruginosa TaxID=287 RepID=UPI001F4DD9CB|nr:hypothetical protein [Pseudomonas aeruginosa]